MLTSIVCTLLLVALVSPDGEMSVFASFRRWLPHVMLAANSAVRIAHPAKISPLVGILRQIGSICRLHAGVFNNNCPDKATHFQSQDSSFVCITQDSGKIDFTAISDSGGPVDRNMHATLQRFQV